MLKSFESLQIILDISYLTEARVVPFVVMLVVYTSRPRDTSPTTVA